MLETLSLAKARANNTCQLLHHSYFTKNWSVKTTVVKSAWRFLFICERIRKKSCFVQLSKKNLVTYNQYGAINQAKGNSLCAARVWWLLDVYLFLTHWWQREPPYDLVTVLSLLDMRVRSWGLDGTIWNWNMKHIISEY